jgi:DNA-binding PadR family transcriptional regulator
VSVTRLLVLGAVRIFQPAHGYLVRRELLSWQVEEWANVKPGSIYNALRTLTRDGLLIEEDAPIAVGGTGPAARATYRLTPDGESEFFRLEREALWQLHPGEPGWLLAGLSFWFALSRQEVLDALAGRRAQLESRLAGAPYLADEIRGSDKPAHVVEYVHMMEAGVRAELEWVQGAAERISSGSYGFAGEDRRRIYGGSLPPDTDNIQV